MQSIKVLTAAGIFFVCIQGYPQNTDGIWTFDRLIEDLILEIEDEAMAEDLVESLFYYYENPIEVNSATQAQLKELFFLSDEQIQNLLQFIKERGSIASIFELQLVDGFDELTIQQVRPFLAATLPRAKSLPKIINTLLVRTDKTLENKAGFKAPADSGCYEGSPFKRLMKFRSARTNRYSAGFVLENDSGEKLLWQPQKLCYGADFLSGHVTLENRGILQTAVIGDYQLSFGQGLALSHSFSVGKGADVVSGTRKTSRGLKPYTGSHEYNFCRGAAATLSWDNIAFTPFYSRKYLDGRATWDMDNDRLYAKSIIGTGLHRTEKESALRQNMSEEAYGMDLQFSSSDRRLEAGLILAKTEYGLSIQPDPTPYNQFAFRGDKILNSGLRLSYNIRSAWLFGELAARDFNNYAGMAGVQAVVAPQTSMAFLYRNYGKAYHAFYGQAFSESSVNNEEGFYWGLDFQLNKKWKACVYYDLFKFHWMKYQLYTVPSWGGEFLTRISYLPNKTASMYLQFKSESQEKNIESPEPVQQTRMFKKDQFLFNLDWQPAGLIALKFRAQGSSYDKTEGFALSQDLNLIWPKVRLFNRIAVFNAGDYDVRQYMYERDVLYAFSFPVLYGKGTRYYSMIEFKARKNLSFWFKVAGTWYNDRESIGTGLEEIQGCKKTDIRLQARYVF